MSPGFEEEANNEAYRMSLRNWRRLGEKLSTGLTLPKGCGRLGVPLLGGMILLQDLAYRGCPGIDAGIVEADLTLRFGTEEQKKRFIPHILPHILRGEVKRAKGMSEADAKRLGLGLASAQMEHRGAFRGPRT